MSNTKKNLTRAIHLVLAGATLLPVASYATNGMFLTGQGTIARGMGGVAIALPRDTLSVAANPATMSEIKRRFDIGGDIFVPSAEARLGTISAESKANGIGIDNVFIMGHMGLVLPINEEYTFGVNVVPAGGGVSRYETNFFNAAQPGSGEIDETLGVNLLIGNVNTSISYKINQSHSIGASLIVGIARFRAEGLALFTPFTQTQTTDNFTNQGNEWSYGLGARIGWLGQFDKLKIGLEYTSEVDMQEFDNYKELFAENGDIDQPANIGVGFSYEFTPKFIGAFDITRTFYSDVRSISNRGPNIIGPPLGGEERRLGLPDGMGFGWDDQTVFKIGGEYIHDDSWTFRAGWNYGESPIDESTEIIFNLVAPATTQNHLHLGLTYSFSPDLQLSGSFVHAFEYTQYGPTYISNDGSNQGEASMSQNSLGVSFGMNF